VKNTRKIIVVAGPTASGKTALSVEWAQKENTVVLSADSRQFYREMNIGTAKPSLKEMKQVQHYFIDSHSIHDPVSSKRFATEATQLLNELFKKHEKVVLTGGSGLFIDALCYGTDDIPHDDAIQKELNEEFQKNGLSPLLIELKQNDPDYFQLVDKNNPRRIIRALEVMRCSNRPYSYFRTGQNRTPNFTIEQFVIDIPRTELYQRINMRVDEMVERGLEQEALSLFAYRHLKPLQTVGYSEWFDFFDGKFDRKTCIERIKQNSRHYAKRQLTWIKRYKNAMRITP